MGIMVMVADVRWLRVLTTQSHFRAKKVKQEMMDHMVGWGWGAGPVTGILIMAGVVVALVWAFRAARPGRLHSLPPNLSDPLHELQMRLARGEITSDEYEELRAHLRE